MRAFLAVLLVIALLLSGCASKGKDKGDGDASTSTSSTSASTTKTSTAGASSSASSTGTGAPKANQAPTGAIEASVNGTNATFRLTGSDPDADPLTWTLAFGDGNATSGTALPANATHTFKAGNYTANFTISDGKANVSHAVNLTVAAGGGKQPFVITATYKGVDPAAAPPVGNPARQPSCVLGDPATPGGPVGGNWHVYDEDLTGWAFTVEPAKFVVIFYQKDGTTRAGTFGSSGVVPADAVEVDICTSDPTAGGTYTFTATPP